MISIEILKLVCKSLLKYDNLIRYSDIIFASLFPDIMDPSAPCYYLLRKTAYMSSNIKMICDVILFEEFLTTPYYVLILQQISKLYTYLRISVFTKVLKHLKDISSTTAAAATKTTSSSSSSTTTTPIELLSYETKIKAEILCEEYHISQYISWIIQYIMEHEISTSNLHSKFSTLYKLIPHRTTYHDDECIREWFPNKLMQSQRQFSLISSLFHTLLYEINHYHHRIYCDSKIKLTTQDLLQYHYIFSTCERILLIRLIQYNNNLRVINMRSLYSETLYSTINILLKHEQNKIIKKMMQCLHSTYLTLHTPNIQEQIELQTFQSDLILILKDEQHPERLEKFTRVFVYSELGIQKVVHILKQYYTKLFQDIVYENIQIESQSIPDVTATTATVTTGNNSNTNSSTAHKCFFLFFKCIYRFSQPTIGILYFASRYGCLTMQALTEALYNSINSFSTMYCVVATIMDCLLRQEFCSLVNSFLLGGTTIQLWDEILSYINEYTINTSSLDEYQQQLLPTDIPIQLLDMILLGGGDIIQNTDIHIRFPIDNDVSDDAEYDDYDISNYPFKTPKQYVENTIQRSMMVDDTIDTTIDNNNDSDIDANTDANIDTEANADADADSNDNSNNINTNTYINTNNTKMISDNTFINFLSLQDTTVKETSDLQTPNLSKEYISLDPIIDNDTCNISRITEKCTKILQTYYTKVPLKEEMFCSQ